MKIFRILFLLFITVNVLFIANSSEKLTIKGNKRIDDKTIVYYLDINKAKSFKKDDIEKMIQSLYSTGFFSDISIKPNGSGGVVVNVKENPIIKRINIDGAKKLNNTAIKKELLSKEGNIYSAFHIESDIKNLSATYKKMGFYSAKINYTLKHVGDYSVDINISINEGVKPRIQKISFFGNKQYSDKDLLKVIASKEFIWYRLFSSSDSYDQDRMEIDKDMLKAFYMSVGYADFDVLSSSSEITPNKESFLISYILHEGELYKFGDTKIDTDIKNIKSEDLYKYIKYKKDEIFNENLVGYTVDMMTKHLGDIGYTFSNIDYQLEKDSKKKVVNIRFSVRETSKYFIRNINIIGNTRTLDRVIRREFRIYENDPFNLSKIQRSKQRIGNLGYFSSVELENKETDEPGKVDVDVKVKEISTGSLKFSVGYNTSIGMIGTVNMSEYNFLGKGQIVELDFSKAKKSMDISFGFMEPKFMDRNLSAGFDVFSTSQDKSSERSYSMKNKGLTLKMGYEINEHLSHQIHYSIKKERSNLDQNAPAFIQAQPKKGSNSSIGYSLTYDYLNSRVNPTNGYLLRFSQDYAGVGGDARYLKNQIYASYYKSLYKDDVVLNLIGRGGNIKGIGKKNVTVRDNYYLGEDYVRGFEPDGIGPRIKEDISKDKESLGGKTFFAGTVEVQFPMGLPEEFGVKGAIFSDFGMLYGNDASKFLCNKESDCKCGLECSSGAKLDGKYIHDTKKIRASYGVGVMWDSPIGFIRLDYGIPFKKESFDKLHRIRLSMGTNF
ncbi:MAG: outer membrane protein insertion porin family [Candidatus Midichloriaceae bacterium]|jgi:outer membrane protein insertion porin family